MPIWLLASMRAWAAAASASGKVESMTGLTRPEAISGKTLFRIARGDDTLIRYRTGAQRRAGMGQALEHDAAEIDGRLRRALERDLHDAALDRRGLVIALDVVAADHVEHNIRAVPIGCLLGDGDEILGLVVDGDVGAELAAGFALFRGACGRDDFCAERLGKLNGGGADAG